MTNTQQEEYEHKEEWEGNFPWEEKFNPVFEKELRQLISSLLQQARKETREEMLEYVWQSCQNGNAILKRHHEFADAHQIAFLDGYLLALNDLLTKFMNTQNDTAYCDVDTCEGHDNE